MHDIKGIIFDFGEVISFAQDPERITQMVDLLGLQHRRDEFCKVYRELRMEYDRGSLSGVEYFQKVINRLELGCDRAVLEKLVDLDVLSWMRINPATLTWIETLKSKGFLIGLLSNMPYELMNYLLSSFEWPQLFDYRIFSCDVKLCKPQKEIYELCLSKMGLVAQQCIFFDDNRDNIEAALRVGLQAIQYTGNAQLNQILGEL